VALTIYTVAQTLVLNNVRTLRHVEPLWFANIANNILWFTFIKAGFRSALALVGARRRRRRAGWPALPLGGLPDRGGWVQHAARLVACSACPCLSS
jgi:hypothetical protein